MVDGGMKDGRADWPPEPEFTYPKSVEFVRLYLRGNFLFLAVLFTVVGLAILLLHIAPGALPLWMVDSRTFIGSILARFRTVSFIGPVLIVLGIVEFGLSFWLPAKMAMPGLAITSAGIFAFRGVTPWRALAWRDISGISRIRTTDPRSGAAVVHVHIRGPHFSLRMGPKIQNDAKACDLITRYAHEHRIALQSTDRGADTMKLHRATMSRSEFQALRRDGVITEISEL